MSERMGHGSLHPAELAGQPFKRADGLGVGQDDGNPLPLLQQVQARILDKESTP